MEIENSVNRKFFEVVVFLRTAMPFLSAPMLNFFPILGFKKLFEKLSQTRIWHLLESVLPAVSTHVWSADDQFDICKSLP